MTNSATLSEAPGAAARHYSEKNLTHQESSAVGAEAEAMVIAQRPKRIVRSDATQMPPPQ